MIDMERKIKIIIENDIPHRINIPGLGRRYISRKMIDDLKKEGEILPLLPAIALAAPAVEAITPVADVIAGAAETNIANKAGKRGKIPPFFFKSSIIFLLIYLLPSHGI